METFKLYVNPRRSIVTISVTLGFALPYAEGVVHLPDPGCQAGIEQAAERQVDEMPWIALAHATAALRPVTEANQPYRL